MWMCKYLYRRQNDTQSWCINTIVFRASTMGLAAQVNEIGGGHFQEEVLEWINNSLFRHLHQNTRVVAMVLLWFQQLS